MIDNPEFKDDLKLYVYPNLNYIGIELWQVKSGTFFDNILVSDDLEYAKKLAEEIRGKKKDGASSMEEHLLYKQEDGGSIPSCPNMTKYMTS
ncbi:hypothetical protein SUGI_0053820 [Cryptomeria japonica]|nr:hypothetical protein SUGI_0053820 [Cryptomeria japonica]